MSIMDELKKLTRPYDDDDTLIDDGSDLDVDVDVEPSYTRPVTPVQPAQEPVVEEEPVREEELPKTFLERLFLLLILDLPVNLAI